MYVRKHLLVVATFSLVSPTLPAGADDGVSAGTQFAGAVVASTESLSATGRGDESHVGTMEMSGKCEYVGVTTLTGQIQFVFGGTTTSYSTVPASSQSIGTRATCTMISPQQPGVPGSPPTLTLTTDIRLSGNAAVTVPALTPPWPLRPVTICVSGDAQFGPAPGERTLGQNCGGCLFYVSVGDVLTRCII